MNDIRCIDCFAGLKELDDHSIDCIITDPPYWLGSNFHIDEKGQYVGHLTDCKHTGKTWKVGDGYWLEALFEEFNRVLKYGGFALVFTIDRLADLPTYNARKAGFDVCQSVYWRFKQGMPKGTSSSKRVDALILQGNASTRALRKQEFANPTGNETTAKCGYNGFSNNVRKVVKKEKTQPMTEAGLMVAGSMYGLACLAPAAETIAVFRKKPKHDSIAEDIKYAVNDKEIHPSVVYVERYRELYRIFPSQVIEISKPSREEKNGNNHPTVKPIDLMYRLVGLFSDKDNIIADPFCGSGTTLMACKLLGRKYVGFDIDQTFVDYAKKRLVEPYCHIVRGRYEVTK